MIKYSAKNHACYDMSLGYKNIPNDLIEITEDEHQLFMGNGIESGKQLVKNVYPFTVEDIPVQPPTKASLMLEGADYNGYQVSFTADDGNGVLQVKAAFDFGLTETNIHFSNGTIMPITAAEFSDFALWFVERRNSFFGGQK